MKSLAYYNLILILLILFAIPTSCMSSPTFLPAAGSGTSVEKNFKVSGFHGIDVSGGFDVILTQGNLEDLNITADEDLFKYIKVEVTQGILRIYIERSNLVISGSRTARISFKSIDKLEVSGGGDIECKTPVNVPELEVSLSGGGDLESEINTDELTCSISGGGDADINGIIKKYKLALSGGGDLKSDVIAGFIECSISGGGDCTFRAKEKTEEVRISMSGGGDITVDVNVEKIQISVSGGGDATLTGQASELEMALSGGGNVNGSDFKTETTSFSVSGGSDIHIYASRELIGNITGGGDVYYSGNPVDVTIDAKGGSKVYKQ
jgi:hypothetical protein